MSILTEITKELVIAKEPIRCKLVVEDRPIEQVIEVDYLLLTNKTRTCNIENINQEENWNGINT